MTKVKGFIKKHSFAIFLIAIGIAMLIMTASYPEVPSGIGPAFFPRIVAIMLIAFSALCIVLNLKKDVKGEVSPTKVANIKIVITILGMIALVLLMKYVHPLVGIALFLFGYMKFFANLNWKMTIIVTVLGTAILFVLILVLKIPM